MTRQYSCSSITRVMVRCCFLALVLSCVLMFASAEGCGGAAAHPCTPAAFDFATVVAARRLLYVDTQPCAEVTQLFSADGDYERAWLALGGTPDARPAVDFGSQRVVLSTRASELGVAWTATDGNAVALGLLQCITARRLQTCATELLVADVVALSAEARICDPAPCGNPVLPAPTTPRP